jgi:hypothetical protein
MGQENHSARFWSRLDRKNMKKPIILFLFLAGLAQAENLYVTPGGAGSTNGTSWANAFAGFSDVAWGSGTGSVGAGDTLYVGAGNYSGTLTIGASGTSTTNRVTIQAAQDTNTGVATLNGNINFNGQSYVTVNGLFNQSRQFVIPSGWMDMTSTTDPKLIGVTIQAGRINATFASLGEWAFNSISIPIPNIVSGGDNDPYSYAVRFNAVNNGTSAYGLSSFHDSTVTIPGTAANGLGPDGLQQLQGFDVYNNTFQVVQGVTDPVEHQDVLQNFGTNYTRLYNNTLIDGGDSIVGFDRGGGQFAHIWVYNNTFVRTINGMGSEMLRFYSIASGTATDVHIDNNTFVDASRTGPDFGSAISFNSAGSVTSGTNCSVQNNIFYNCGRGYNVFRASGVAQLGWQVTNNLVNAGAHGNTNLEWTFSNTQSGAPSFVSYTEYSVNNNLRLTATGVAVGNGANLSARFTTDKDGNTRTVPWSIGAYQGGGGPDLVPPTLQSATVIPAGNQLSLTFDKPVQAGSGGSAGWTLGVSPTASVGSVLTGIGTATLTYAITGRLINAGESLTLTYSQPGSGIESVASGTDLAAISSKPVTNNSTQGQTVTPTITLPAGPYFGTQTTTITSPDTASGAVIRYTTDGSTPTASSSTYSAPLSISTNQTIKAISIWSGHPNSAVASSDFEVVSWVTPGTAWKTFAVPQKTGTFTWNFSATAPAAGGDAVVGLGPAAVSDYPGMACIVQFSANTINARNGGSYTVGPPSSPGALYNFVAVINVTAHTWSLTVTPAAGGASSTILTNAAFRTEQASAAQLSWVGMQAITDSLNVSNMAFPSGASSARYIGIRGVPASGGATP